MYFSTKLKKSHPFRNKIILQLFSKGANVTPKVRVT